MRSTMRGLAVAILLLMPSTLPTQARTWIVSQDGTGDFSSVAAACDSAAAGDSVLIRPGEYREEAHDDPTDPGIALWEKSIAIMGDGSAEAVSLQMKFGFINCDGVLISNVRLHHVKAAITIWSEWGLPAPGSYLIRSCLFDNNEARSYGGGAILAMMRPDGDIVIEDCTFKTNQAPLDHGSGGEGGAINADYLTIRRCIFRSNHATRGGGAVYSNAAVIEDCLFISNSAPHGAAVVLNGNGRITRSTFYKNDCLGEVGGAILIGGDVYSYAPDHCIIAETNGAAIECPGVGSAKCCDVWGTQIEPDPWCAFAAEDGNFYADPLFCDPEGGDFGLLENSPCLPGNHGGYNCGRIGAGAEFCGIIPVRETTWGKLKTLWR